MSLRIMAEREKTRLEQSIEKKHEELKNLPEGSLGCYKKGEKYNWYIIDNGSSKRTYLPKKDRAIAEQLALKGYLSSGLRDEEKELRAITMYLKNAPAVDHMSDYLTRNDEHQRLVAPYLKNHSLDITAWQDNQYTGSVPNSERRRLTTQAGIKVRSKSERMIVSLLCKHHIPFKYEYPILVSGKELFPDFTIMHPVTHRIYIWEHFGIMDDANYMARSLDKIRQYYNVGFIAGDNLILTFESGDRDLDEIYAEFLIEHTFE